MKTVTFTIQEIWMQTKHKVEKSKKTYTRKNKHKNNGKEKGGSSEK